VISKADIATIFVSIPLNPNVPTAKFALKEFLKLIHIWQSYIDKKVDCLNSPMCLQDIAMLINLTGVHTRHTASITVVTVLCYDNRPQ